MGELRLPPQFPFNSVDDAYFASACARIWARSRRQGSGASDSLNQSNRALIELCLERRSADS